MASQSIPRANISVKIKHGIQVIVFEKTNTAFVEFAEFKRSILKGNTVHVENYI